MTKEIIPENLLEQKTQPSTGQVLITTDDTHRISLGGSREA